LHIGRTLLRDGDGSTAWRDWIDAAGIDRMPTTNTLVIPDPNVRVQAVMDGQGIALYDYLVDDEVVAGRLYQYPLISLDEYGYYLVYPDDVSNDDAIRIFRDWIIRQASPA
jgi:DNA-binding transcriptional LysR family regulator